MIEGEGDDWREARALADIRERLEREFPAADSDRIADLLAGCYRRTTGATVQHFRAVLVITAEPENVVCILNVRCNCELRA